MHDSLPSRRSGFTLPELATGLCLVGLLLGIALPRAGGAGDRWAVIGARDQIATLGHRVRLEARSHGAAQLVFSRERGVEVQVAGEVLHRVDVAEAGVELELGGRDSLVLRWDALGVGRVASRTVRLRRGRAEAIVVFASTGRIRRR